MEVKNVKNYCKTHRLKFECIKDDIFIASQIINRKVSSVKDGLIYSKWKKIFSRNATLFQILPDNDIVGIKNDIGGKYHPKETKFIFTNENTKYLSKYRLKN